MSEPPLGVQHLSNNNHLIVKKKTTFVHNNKCIVFDTKSKPLLFAKKEYVALNKGKRNQAIYVDLYDENKQKVITCRSPYTIGAYKMEVSLCGQVVSVIRVKPTFQVIILINDANDKPMLRMKGGPMGIPYTPEYELQTADKKSIGRIQKIWGGLMTEKFTKSDDFHIHFPMDLDVRSKAGVLGACIFIDVYFNKN